MTGATTTVTKRFAVILAAGLFTAGLLLAIALSTGQGASADGHVTGGETIVLSHTEVEFDTGASRSPEEVWIYGSGFTPGIEVELLVADFQGALYVISACRWDNEGNCDPGRYRDGAGSVWPLIVNEDGAFATKWRLGRFTRSNVGTERMASMWAVDKTNYTFLASAPIALCDLTRNADLEEGAEPAEVPGYCSA